MELGIQTIDALCEESMTTKEQRVATTQQHSLYDLNISELDQGFSYRAAQLNLCLAAYGLTILKQAQSPHPRDKILSEEQIPYLSHP